MSTDQVCVCGGGRVAKDHPPSWTLKQPCPALACWLGNSQGRDAPDPACPLPRQPPHAGGLHKRRIPYIAGSPGGGGLEGGGEAGVAGAQTLRILLLPRTPHELHASTTSVSDPHHLRLSSALVDSGMDQVGVKWGNLRVGAVYRK